MDHAATGNAHKRHCVLLADRHHRLSEGVRGLLETAFEQVFMVADHASLMEGTRRLLPALVVVDIGVADGDVGRLLRSIHERAPDCKTLLLSLHDEASVARSAAAAGADGLVPKCAIATDLMPAVDAVLAGGRYFRPTRH